LDAVLMKADGQQQKLSRAHRLSVESIFTQ